jgi:TonB family protein
MTYILQVNLYLVLFYGFYRLILQNETFHQLNRSYLVVSAVLSFGIPFWYSDYVQSWFLTQQINEVIYTAVLSTDWITVRTTPTSMLTWMDVLKGIYTIGLMAFAIRLIIILAQLVVVLKRKQIEKYEAFSFFGYSFVADTLQKRDTILAHEHVHVQQLHSFDVMLFEVIAILNWFNPVVYLYKRDVKHIHEFIADEIASTKEVSKADYAMLLFSREFGVLNPSTLTNQFFNHSTLKRRIFMLQKTKSKQTALLKYGLIFPLFILMLVFSSAWIAKSEGLEKVEKQVKTPILLIENLQNPPLKGKVVTSDGKPLPGVAISIYSKKIGTTTDINGDFILPKVENNDKINFEFIGFKGQSIIFKGDESVKIIMLIDEEKTIQNIVEEVRISPNKTVENDEVFTSTEEMPQYEGGFKSAFEFISREVKYPVLAQRNGTTGKVFIKFIVEKDGSISEPTILKGIGSGCDEEAVRVISLMPKWKAGKQNGNPVRSWFTMPINFLLEPVVSSAPYVSENKEVGKILPPEQPLPKIEFKSGTTTDKETVIVGKAMPYSPEKINPNFNINGASTTKMRVNGLVDPIWVLDGIIQNDVDKEGFKNIDPMDIESISVLKDVNATKIYGDKGKNGVIIVTTKSKNGGSFPVKKENSSFEISGGFSPNGDGINDLFIIKTIKKVEYLEVYDKMGKLVYRKENYQNDWDGKAANGGIVPDGTYYYHLKLEDEVKPRYGYMSVQK